MKSVRFALGSFLFLAFFGHVAQAQLQRTFVSGLGSDGNPCTRIAPCRTFAQAVSQTSDGGEVIVLDSAGYGPVTIFQISISLTAPAGVYAGSPGVVIQGMPSKLVILRGLTVTRGSGGPGDIGISFAGPGGTLHVENCVVTGFGQDIDGAGLRFGTGNLVVRDSAMKENANGILMVGSASASAIISHVNLESNLINGLYVSGGFGSSATVATIRDSTATLNGDTGFRADSQGPQPVELNIENCTASNNTLNGVLTHSASGGVSTIRISNSIVTDNGTGLRVTQSIAVLLSRGNNTVEGNKTNTSGPIGTYTAK
jgi:hypothetical protein